MVLPAVKAYLQLAKPRIALMVALTVWLGWALAGGTATASLFLVMLGSSLAAAACGALNQRLEIVEDGIMHRTRNRPLPTGRVSPEAALIFGLVLSAAGPALVWAAGGGGAGGAPPPPPPRRRARGAPPAQPPAPPPTPPSPPPRPFPPPPGPARGPGGARRPRSSPPRPSRSTSSSTRRSRRSPRRRPGSAPPRGPPRP